MIVTIMQIITAISTIALVPEPTQMMMRGPRAILGSAFSTTRYGSAILRAEVDSQSSTAITLPRTMDTAKPMTVSSSVMPI